MTALHKRVGGKAYRPSWKIKIAFSPVFNKQITLNTLRLDKQDFWVFLLKKKIQNQLDSITYQAEHPPWEPGTWVLEFQ